MPQVQLGGGVREAPHALPRCPCLLRVPRSKSESGGYHIREMTSWSQLSCHVSQLCFGQVPAQWPHRSCVLHLVRANLQLSQTLFPTPSRQRVAASKGVHACKGGAHARARAKLLWPSCPSPAPAARHSWAAELGLWVAHHRLACQVGAELGAWPCLLFTSRT